MWGMSGCTGRNASPPTQKTVCIKKKNNEKKKTAMEASSDQLQKLDRPPGRPPLKEGPPPPQQQQQSLMDGGGARLEEVYGLELAAMDCVASSLSRLCKSRSCTSCHCCIGCWPAFLLMADLLVKINPHQPWGKVADGQTTLSGSVLLRRARRRPPVIPTTSLCLAGGHPEGAVPEDRRHQAGDAHRSAVRKLPRSAFRAAALVCPPHPPTPTPPLLRPPLLPHLPVLTPMLPVCYRRDGHLPALRAEAGLLREARLRLLEEALHRPLRQERLRL